MYLNLDQAKVFLGEMANMVADLMRVEVASHDHDHH